MQRGRGLRFVCLARTTAYNFVVGDSASRRAYHGAVCATSVGEMATLPRQTSTDTSPVYQQVCALLPGSKEARKRGPDVKTFCRHMLWATAVAAVGSGVYRFYV